MNWHSVEKDPPQFDGKYLVYTKFHGHQIMTFKDKQWWIHVWQAMLVTVEPPTHWMHLHVTPEEEEAIDRHYYQTQFSD